MHQPDDPTRTVAVFDGVLEGLRNRLQAQESDALDAAVRGYVEDAIEAALSAASRLRGDAAAEGDALAAEVREAIAVARALLEELRGSTVRSWALVDRSLELRRRAVRACARARTAGLPPAAPSKADARPDHRARPLEGVRLLVVTERPDLAVTLTTLVCGLGADAHAALGLRHAIEASRICRPHVLLCDVPPLVAGAPSLMHDLRREGVIVPTVALAASVDAATREVARSAGFSAVLPADATSDQLSDAILTAVG